MASEATHDAGTTDEIAELERKIAELRIAHAHMKAERDQYTSNAARTATALDGLTSISRALDILQKEHAAARDTAAAAREAADAAVRDARQRLDEARQTAHALAAERVVAERAAAQARAAEARASASYDQTSRTVSDVRATYEAARAESANVARRDAPGDNTEEFEREKLSAETRLHKLRVRAESVHAGIDLQRIRDLERCLRSIRLTTVSTTSAAQMRPPEAPSLARQEVATPDRISLATRLRRDLGTPSPRP